MAIDEALCKRIRDSLADHSGITEKKMFGGMCFLDNGNMLCGVDPKRGFSVRVGAEQYEEVMKLKHAREMDFTGRPMKGMVYVEREGCKTTANLAKWIARGLAFTQSLPKKARSKPKKTAKSTKGMSNKQTTRTRNE